MPSINSSFPSHTANLTAPLLPAASTDVPHLRPYAEETAGQTALLTRNAYPQASGSTMRRMLHAAMGSVTSGASSAYHGTINVGLAGYDIAVRPVGSAVINTTLATLLHVGDFGKDLLSFGRESITGVELVDGHKVSGREDSLLKLPQRLLSASVRELFASDGRSLLTKGSDFMKTARTYGGGVAGSFIHQMGIVTVSDTVGRLCAQATVNEFSKGNFVVPLAATGMLTLLSAAQQTYLLQSIKHFNALKAEQKSAVIASHHGITREAFDAKPEIEREKLEGILKRDWLVMGGTSALMPGGAFIACLIAAASPATAFDNPLFKGVAENLIKVAVRSPVYGLIREMLQEIFTATKGGAADLTHAEAGWVAIKFGAISAGVNIGQDAAQQFVHNLFNSSHSDFAHESALTLDSPSTSNWGETAATLMAYSFVNGIGESINWADSTSDRTKKSIEIAKKDLIDLHEASGMPPPTPEELKKEAELIEAFALDLGVKKQTLKQALINIGRRGGGSLAAREGVYAMSNAISNSVSTTADLIDGNGSYRNLTNLILGFTTIFSSIKFNACSQSMGHLRAIRAKNERDPHSSVRHLIDALDELEDMSSIGENLVRSESIHVDNPSAMHAGNIRGFGRRSFSANLYELERATRGFTKRHDSRVMTDDSRVMTDFG